jgi:hypothetical protein
MVLVDCVVLLLCSVEVVAVLLKLKAFCVGDLRNNRRIAVGLICANYLVRFKDKTGNILVWVVLNCLDNFVAIRLVKGV